ncbi:MAG: flavodoxin family protein [Desulfobulbaceae bacterium]|nr:flavodoxin family protein [Desulfobulbaceae bacterium]
MAKKIMILVGSPRRQGNTQTVAGWFAQGAKEVGCEVEMIDITRLQSKYGGCIACMGCQKSDKYECVVADEVSPVLARMPQADGVVFATPTYFFGISAQTKSLLDRMFSLIKFNPEVGGYEQSLKQVKLGAIATAGGDIAPGLQLIDNTFRAMAGFSGLGYEALLVPFSPRDPSEMAGRTEVREQALAFGRRFLGEG